MVISDKGPQLDKCVIVILGKLCFVFFFGIRLIFGMFFWRCLGLACVSIELGLELGFGFLFVFGFGFKFS